MDLCSNDHDEICFDSRSCPLCDMRDEYEAAIAGLNEDIKTLKEDSEKYKDFYNELISQYPEYEI